MTDAEALKWLTRRSAILVMHEDRIVVALPDNLVRVQAKDGVGLQISIPPTQQGGYVLAISDKGDSIADVVEAARAEWRKRVSTVDSLADTQDSWRHAPVKMDFETDRPLFMDQG